jgi:putative DNA-invertase from lambdoid prophage Rac
LLAVTQNIDTDESNPMSRFPLHILAAFGELEREMIREQVRAGLRTAKAQGRPLGRPRWAFRCDEAVRLRAQGVSWRKIAQLPDLPMSTVIDACRSKRPRAPLADQPAETRQIRLAAEPFQKQVFSCGAPRESGRRF